MNGVDARITDHGSSSQKVSTEKKCVVSPQVIASLLEHLGPRGSSSRFFVEFGFSTPSWTAERRAGTGPNTQFLKFRRGWDGVLFDVDYHNPAINLHREFLTPATIVTSKTNQHSGISL